MHRNIFLQFLHKIVQKIAFFKKKLLKIVKTLVTNLFQIKNRTGSNICLTGKLKMLKLR